MSNDTKQIYQFKISLLDTEIWRRIQVPEDYTFGNLHYVIQNAMGWENDHPYHFLEKEREPIPEKRKIKSTFSLEHKKVHYEYDFGDSWLHEVLLEKILPVVDGVRYPICTAGKMACPPEDCGGIPGYYSLLKIIKSPKHEEYCSTMEWLGDEYFPEKFDPKDVRFDKSGW